MWVRGERLSRSEKTSLRRLVDLEAKKRPICSARNVALQTSTPFLTSRTNLTLRLRFARRSAASDCVSNVVRILKTYRQTVGEDLSYTEVFKIIMEEVRVCEERSDELRRRVCWIFGYSCVKALLPTSPGILTL